MDVSCAGVAPNFAADGGRVPWAGDSEFREEKVRSPNPLVSPSSTCPGERACVGDVLAADRRALPLVVRASVAALGAGVRGFVAVVGASDSNGRAPVISKSGSLTTSGDFCAGAPRFARVALVLVTSPSLSSLKVCSTAAAFLVCFVVGFVVAAGAALLDALGFVTRVVVVSFDCIFVRAGRGIVADEC